MASHLKTLAVLTAGGVTGLLMAPQTVQAVTNYFDATKTVSGSGSATCPYGWKMTGGGIGTLPSDYYGSISSDEYSITGSYPYSNGWKVTAKKIHGSYTSSSGWRFTTSNYSAQAYAVCVS